MEKKPLQGDEEYDKRAEKALNQRLKFQKIESRIDQEALWNRIKTDAQEPAKIRRLPRNWRLMVSGAVAASLLLLSYFVFNGIGNTEISAPFASTETFILPDQSEIQLNAGSQIQYQASKWEENRSLKLKGEAYFKVEKGTRFTVNTTQGSVEVLGTEFNVFAWDDEFRVICTEGRVAVRTKNEELVLTPGQQIILNEAGEMQQQQAEVVSWLGGVFIYENEPLGAVLDELERQFGVRVKIDSALRERKISTQFTRESLEEIVDKIAYALSVNGEIEKDIVRFTR